MGNLGFQEALLIVLVFVIIFITLLVIFIVIKSRGKNRGMHHRIAELETRVNELEQPRH